MKSKITFKLPFLLFLTLFCLAFGQKNDPKDKIVFGKVYSLEELRKTNGFVRCASTEYEAMLQQKDPKRMTEQQFEDWIGPLIANAQANKSQNGGIITIPVVVHVIHNGESLGTAPNITDTQVQSQITVMNNDYRKLAGTPGANTSPVGADTMIQFALAKVDPKGNPTNGIDRVKLCQDSWATSAIDSYVKPVTIWDPTKYMNMWSVKFSNTELLGYAQFPSNSTLPGLNTNGGYANTDGVVANYATFGSSSYNDGTFLLSAPYDRGRTMTHEVGHFLGLRHIWGDATCGNDYVADTPIHRTSNGGCPAHPKANTCGTPDEMFENYMDYTNDTCMNIFTINQKDRIVAVMNNSPRRMELKTSTADLPITLFANDAELKGEKSCDQTACMESPTSVTAQFSLYNRGTSALTSAVITYSVNGGATQTTNWNGNLAQDKYAIINIPTGVATGSISAQITSVNATTDQRASNNASSVVLGNIVPVSSTNFTFELQLDYWGSETTWSLKNSSGTTLYSGGPYTDVVDPNTDPLPALMTQNWVLPLNDCYTFTINDSEGDGIFEYDGSYRILNSAGAPVIAGNDFTTTQERKFKVVGALATSEVTKEKNTAGIYPNPVSDVLNVTNVANHTKYDIYNAVGQIVKSGALEDQKIRVAELAKGTYFITFKNDKKVESVKFIKK
ncbi:putative secreted protein (Por secretion system target) [Chryseobacterium sp. 52]|uniref:M43 family zinc metalloprotease n=1 Tax=Chryseobacterium sp. 52 TaxID=2035213 RepID=UPI000C19A105|nr:M43 family zinc metalloprotease [Chryseobacterium sp. 52]PIF44651.1 putative secreted protein (Por secretion system target) [Chryseobacterium sp. 52]